MKQQLGPTLMTRLVPVAAAAALAVGLLGGCGEKEDPLAAIRKDAAVLFPTRPKLPANVSQSDMESIVHLSVVRFDIPYETPVEVSSLWRALSIRGFSPATLSRLAVNGIQIGRGRMNRAGELEKLLADLGAKMRGKSMITALQDKPASIQLNRRSRGYTIFVLRPDMTMVGKDHRPGRSMFSVSCRAITDNARGQRVELTFLPQIKTNRRKATYLKDAHGYTMKYVQGVDSFYELIWRATMSRQEFLVIGPSMAAVSESSPGHQFLLREVGGKRFATLLLIRVETAGASGQPR